MKPINLELKCSLLSKMSSIYIHHTFPLNIAVQLSLSIANNGGARRFC